MTIDDFTLIRTSRDVYESVRGPVNSIINESFYSRFGHFIWTQDTDRFNNMLLNAVNDHLR